MNRIRRVAPRLLLSLVLPCLFWGCGASGSAFDRKALEEREDLTESLANDLLALSVDFRERDLGAVQAYFADSLEATPFPLELPRATPLAKRILRREWEIPPDPRPMDRAAFMDSVGRFVGGFTEIVDARFKVKRAEFDSSSGTPRGKAKIKFFIIGRDADGQRVWITGWAEIKVARAAEETWRIERFQFTSLDSKIATADLFSDVTLPAGVAVGFPAFGTGSNQGFVSHGAAAGDVNNDGLLDIATTGVDQNYLYINDGDGHFRDVSAESLVKFAPVGSGALFLDYDNDGDRDLFFAAVGNQILFENRFVPDGEVRFWDVSEQSGVGVGGVGFSALSADVNGDGYPDIYVASYNRYGTVMPNSWIRATNGTPNLLFVNQGDGTFREAASDWGVADDRWSYAAGFVDIDLDGDQDLYVANDFGENAMYRNEGGRFTDAAPEMGIVDPGFGMGVSFGDYDNDGDLDLHVTNMSSTAGNRILKLLYPPEHEINNMLGKQAAGNSLYANNGDGTFRDVTQEVGGFSGGWAFGGGFLDFDNDGWEDIYTPNGFISGKSMKDT